MLRKGAYWFSLAVIFIVPWESMLKAPTVGPIVKVIGILAILFWIASVAFSGKIRSLRTFHLLLYPLLLWNISTLLWSVDTGLTLGRIQTLVQLVIFLLLIWDVYTTPEAVRAGMQAYILGAYVSFYSVISNFLTGSGSAKNSIRFTAEGFDPNNLGFLLAMGIPVAWYLAVSGSDDQKDKVVKWFQILNYGYIPISILVILLTASRTALLTTMPGFLFIFLTLGRLRLIYKLLSCLVFIGALYLVQSLIPASTFERLGTAGSEISAGSLNGRTEIWEQGIDEFWKTPYLGVGGGAYRAAVPIGKDPHSTYVSVLTEQGVIGFSLFFLMIFVMLYQALKIPNWMGKMWMAVLVIWFLGITVQTYEHRKPTWVFVSLIGASVALYRRPQAESAPFQTAKSDGGVRLPGSHPNEAIIQV